MPTNLPWRVAEHSGAIYDCDGVLVCETSAEDAAAIVEAMNLRAAVEALAPYYVKVKPSEILGEWVVSVQRKGLHDYARGATPAAALIALAGGR